MSIIAPRPIVTQVVQTWRLMGGLTYALVQDIESRCWIVESCPAGTRYWTPEQAAQLPQGRQTRTAIQAALRRANELGADVPATNAPTFDYALPDPIKRLLEASEVETPQPMRRVHAKKSCLCA